ncbi:hypothetical protein QR680_008469 [Steinernema hermaphroditum]|uniref:Uncharacterized protein n=1 Tax=Steinernema hermaphroditum TaxID=289476 RepID=A0AA39M7X3_9BILA|nr:hypothetical protein QR680_008469 [Steinernema hermaphroditum]
MPKVIIYIYLFDGRPKMTTLIDRGYGYELMSLEKAPLVTRAWVAERGVQAKSYSLLVCRNICSVQIRW